MGRKFKPQFIMSEYIQDKAKSLNVALGKQLGKEFHTMFFACLGERGEIRTGIFPCNTDKMEGIDLIELGHYIINIGIEMGYRKQEEENE